MANRSIERVGVSLDPEQFRLRTAQLTRVMITLLGIEGVVLSLKNGDAPYNPAWNGFLSPNTKLNANIVLRETNSQDPNFVIWVDISRSDQSAPDIRQTPVDMIQTTLTSGDGGVASSIVVQLKPEKGWDDLEICEHDMSILQDFERALG